MFEKLTVKSREKVSFVSLTSKLNKFVKKSEVENGLLVVNVPHTTAAVTINEGADPDVRKDIIFQLNELIPFDNNYDHLEGNSAAHIKSSIIGCSEMIIIRNGKLLLGRWQDIYFCEFDGPRNRNVNLQIINTNNS